MGAAHTSASGCGGGGGLSSPPHPKKHTTTTSSDDERLGRIMPHLSRAVVHRPFRRMGQPMARNQPKTIRERVHQVCALRMFRRCHL
jgi:hypothetical protein